MAEREAQAVQVIYDGGCGFCVRSLRVVKRLDIRRALRFHDATDRERVAALFPGLPSEDLDEAMYVVDGEGETFRGFFAFRRLLWASPLLWPLLPLFYCPGAGVLGPRVYAWVARNRLRFGCWSDACPLPPGPQEPRGGRE